MSRAAKGLVRILVTPKPVNAYAEKLIHAAAKAAKSRVNAYLATVNASAKRRSIIEAVMIEDFCWKDWETIMERYQYKCAYCLEDHHDLTMDHVIPLSKGGKHHKSNIIPACKPCNSRKGNRPAHRYDPVILPWK